MAAISGRARHAKPDQQIVVYTHSGVWWIQPFVNQPFTRIQPDSTWRSSTHLGTEYAVLLVDSDYRPTPKLVTLPAEGNGVVAMAVVPGKQVLVTSTAQIHFSGYDWSVRSADSDRGGEPNSYDPANVWIDRKGYLHLQMGQRNGRWSCAEVSLTRSLGYGTYQFVVGDTLHLSPSAVFGVFTWDEVHSQNVRDEIDIEQSRWGDPGGLNGQYAIQPFYLPENLYRFSTPAGLMTHALRWDRKAISFRTYRGPSSDLAAHPVATHSFTANLPLPGPETIHLDLYDFHHAENRSNNHTEEVVVELFRFNQ